MADVDMDIDLGLMDVDDFSIEQVHEVGRRHVAEQTTSEQV